MDVGSHELVVHQKDPYGMHELPFAMFQDTRGGHFRKDFIIKVLNDVRQLEQVSVEESETKRYLTLGT